MNETCPTCHDSGRTDNHVTGEIECSNCEGSGVAMNETELLKPIRELEARITNYLELGGFFNPEQMEHNKVRDLLMDCREFLTGLDKSLKEREEGEAELDLEIHRLHDEKELLTELMDCDHPVACRIAAICTACSKQEQAVHTAKADALVERTAQLIAHRACCGTEHDPAHGKFHGFCVVCGVPWPCEYAGEPPKAIVERKLAGEG